MMVLARNYVLSTMTGHAVRFIANTPVFVPSNCVNAAVSIGASPADGDLPTPVISDTAVTTLTPVIPTDTDSRASLIRMAIDLITKDGRSEEFDHAGYPKRDIVSKYTGFTVSNRELLEVFDAMKAAEQAEKDVAAQRQSDAVATGGKRTTREKLVDTKPAAE